MFIKFILTALSFASVTFLVQAEPINIVGRGGGHGSSSTQTVTVTKTITRTFTPSQTVCPPTPTPTFTLKFDDLSCGGICPFPLDYQTFHFNGASGWQLVSSSALSTEENRNLAVASQPNALMTQSSGFVDFGSVTKGFTFDVVRFQFSLFSNNDDKDVIFFMEGTTISGAKKLYSVREPSGILLAPYLLDLASPIGDALGFKELVNIAFAAYTSYDPVTKTGMPATIIFDNFEFIKHPNSGV